jgi:hypothetical protein
MNNDKPAQLESERMRLCRRRGGFALSLMLCTVVILIVIGAGVLKFGLYSRRMAVQSSSEIAARSAADAGVTEALFLMNEKLKVQPWDDSSLPYLMDETLPNSDATYSYTVTGDLSNNYLLESIGTYGQKEKTIGCTLSLQGPFEHAILSLGPLILKTGTIIDGYNSQDPWDTDIDVLIATQSTAPESLVLYNEVVVNGDVAVGVGGDVDTVIRDLGATTWRRYALNKQIEIPPVYPPELTDKGQGIHVHGNTLIIGPGDTGQYGKIEVRRNVNPGTLEINGGDVTLYVTGDVRLGQECEIVIKDGSSLVLYLDGDMIADNDAGINNQAEPTSLKVFGTSTDEQNLTIKAKSEALGAIYAPNAIVTIIAYNDIRGSVTSKSFELKTGGNFYYDEALRNVTTEDIAVRFVIREWSEW